MERAKDVLSSRAQQRFGFTVATLPDCSTLEGNLYDDALRDNTQTPVPDQVIFRIDFPAWLATLSDRDKRVVRDLMQNDRTMEVSRRYGISSARISQLRREFKEDWERFGEEPANEPLLAA